jgi:REP element-mobilizing transposase RayT
MPRQPRAEYESGVYHVIARGNRRHPIYADDADHERYIGRLGRIVVRMRWSCMAFCLMRNHVHLLIETRMPNLGVGMQRLHGPYAQYFNGRHDEVGHLFQGRFKAVPIRTDAHFCMVAAYIANNPVAAGLCRAAVEWPWSSHAATLRGTEPDWLDVGRLHAYFGAQGGDPELRLREFVDAAAKLKGLSL